ncbi:MAG: hypothetical protein WC729_29975 [Sphingomonas sp.]|jgi:hypothetical protein|uniref:hypothetical protein n=1 Tax=Sphingomonas sp. TaxID=28214 RepID=UPI00356B5290
MRLKRALEIAADRGESAGMEGAAETYREFPRAMDDLVQEPYWLSGEWAGQGLSELLGDLMSGVDDDDDAIMGAFETAASTAFWDELERVATLHTEDDDDDGDDDDDDDDDDGDDDDDDDDDDEERDGEA